MALKLRTIDEFIALDNSRQVDLVVKLYMQKCTREKIFLKKGLAPKYFQLRNFFLKPVADVSLTLLYQYLIDMKENRELSLNDLFKNARAYQTNVRIESDRGQLQGLKSYKEFSLDML